LKRLIVAAARLQPTVLHLAGKLIEPADNLTSGWPTPTIRHGVQPAVSGLTSPHGDVHIRHQGCHPMAQAVVAHHPGLLSRTSLGPNPCSTSLSLGQQLRVTTKRKPRGVLHLVKDTAPDWRTDTTDRSVSRGCCAILPARLQASAWLKDDAMSIDSALCNSGGRARPSRAVLRAIM